MKSIQAVGSSTNLEKAHENTNIFQHKKILKMTERERETQDICPSVERETKEAQTKRKLTQTNRKQMLTGGN